MTVATVVVADDDDDLREVFVDALCEAGHEVHPADDGRAAIEAIRVHRPDLLLLDVWMPVMTGFDVLETLRHDSLGSRLKVIVVSNLGDADSRLAAFEAGASAYLVKGRSLSEMLALVAQTLEDTEGLGALA
jgi:DNA-binding response OmpR family regulator